MPSCNPPAPAKSAMEKFSSIQSPKRCVSAPANSMKVHCKTSPLAEAAGVLIEIGNPGELPQIAAEIVHNQFRAITPNCAREEPTDATRSCSVQMLSLIHISEPTRLLSI